MKTFHTLTRGGLLIAAIVLAVPALAQQPPAGKPMTVPAQPSASAAQSAPPAAVDLRQIYPKDSIASQETADRALQDVKKERAAIEARFKYEEKMCYQNEFFANRCRSQAKERRRLALAEVRSVQIEANQYKRHAAVVKRDQDTAQKRASEPADRQKRSASAEAHAKRITAQQQHTQKQQQAAEGKRAKNEADFAKKVKQNAERRREVAIKKAKNEERRRKKATPQASDSKPASAEMRSNEPTQR